MDKRTNAGYDIIKVIALPDEEYVLGVKMINGENQYVTWCCVEKTNYHYGHYFSNYKPAIRDLYTRAQQNIKWTLENLL
jgi:hypothetical protein